MPSREWSTYPLILDIYGIKTRDDLRREYRSMEYEIRLDLVKEGCNMWWRMLGSSYDTMKFFIDVFDVSDPHDLASIEFEQWLEHYIKNIKSPELIARIFSILRISTLNDYLALDKDFRNDLWMLYDDYSSKQEEVDIIAYLNDRNIDTPEDLRKLCWQRTKKFVDSFRNLLKTMNV